MTTQQAVKAEKVEKIHGIDASLVRAESVDAALKTLRIEVPKKADLPKKVGMLKQFFETHPAGDLLECDRCLGTSLKSFDACPFCGDGEEAGTGVKSNGVVRHASPELDQHVAEVRRLQTQVERGGWHLAKAITDGAQSNVWKSRVDGSGKVAYRTYEQFAAAELGMSRKYVQALMKIYLTYPKELVEEAGTSKLRLLIAAPPEKQAEVLEKIKKGASKREVAKVAREDKEKARPSKPPAPSEKRSTITVATIEGKKSVRLYCKPPRVKEEYDEKELRPAKRVGDMPWGWIDLTNDVRMTFTVAQNAAGELVMKTHVQRIG